MTNHLCYLSTLAVVLFVLSGCFGGISPTKGAEQQRRIADLNDRASARYDTGNDDDAAGLLKEALHLASSLDDTEGQIITLLNQARLERKRGNLQLAGTILDQALVQANGFPLYADTAQEKALLELSKKRLDEAWKWAETAFKAEKGELIGRRLNLLARIALLKGNVAEATRQAELALSANSRDGFELERANSLRMLGLIKTQSGQFDKAEEMLQEALTLDKQQSSPTKIAADLDALAELAGRKQEPVRKQEYLNRAKLVRENSQPAKRP